MNCRLVFINNFRSAETLEQTADAVFVSLIIRGLDYYRDVSGEYYSPGPLLKLVLPGETISFRFNETRSNWVAGFQCPALTRKDDGRIALDWNGNPVIFSGWLPLYPNQINPIEERYRLLYTLFNQPTPMNLCRAELVLMGILQHFLCPQGPGEGKSQPAALKSLLDDPVNDKISLAELSQGFGLSEEHLRARFKAMYHLSPKQYRQRQIMARAMQLVTGSKLLVKEIAHKLGYTYASHFSAQFSTHHGLSPVDAISRYRTWGGNEARPMDEG